MPISFSCAGCSKVINAPENLAGRKAQCPRCKKVVEVPPAPPPSPPIPSPPTPHPLPQGIVSCPFCRGPVTIVGAPPAIVCPHCHGQFPPYGGLPYPLPDLVPHPDDEARVEAAANARAVDRRRQQAKESAAIMHSLGMGSMVLALVGFVFAFIPVVSMFSLPVSAMGILLALAGIFAAMSKKGHAIGLPIAGLASNIISIAAAVLWVSLASQLGQLREGTAGKSKETHTIAAWIDASKSGVRQGDAQIRVTDVRVGRVILRDGRGELSEPADRYLTIRLEVENLSTAKKIPFEGWAGHTPFLKDAGGNIIKRKTFPAGQRIEGQAAIKPLPPRESTSDLLVFEVPATIGPLKLDLPATAFHGVGRLGFQIPKTMISE